MKTVKPVSKETYERIGKAYLICSQYPDVFGDVTMKKFCSMFVDVLDDDEDEHEARKKENADAMYWVLRNILYELKHGTGADRSYIQQVINDIGGLLAEIDGKEDVGHE